MSHVSFFWQSMMTRRVPVHQIISEHDQSRSYQPSNTGIAAYYQAEQTAGLAVCPPPLHRVNSSHHVHGESPAEEVRAPALIAHSICFIRDTEFLPIHPL